MKTIYTKAFFTLLFALPLTLANGQDTTAYSIDCRSPWKLNIQASPLLTSLTSNTYSNEEKSKPGFNGGLSLAYYFKNNSKLKIGASLGFGYSVYKASRTLNYNDSARIADGGGEQVHVFEQGSITEKQTITQLTMPLQLHFDYALNSKFALYTSVGYYFSLNTSGKYSSEAVLSRQGYYPGLNALIYGVDVTGSDYFYPENKPMSDNGDLTVRNSGGILASVGMKYEITPKVALFGGIKASFGLGNISDYSGNNSVVIADDYQHLNSLMSRGDKIQTHAYGLEIGMSVNLGRCKSKKAEKLPLATEPIMQETQPVQKDTLVQQLQVIVTEKPAEVPVVAETQQDTIKPVSTIPDKDDIIKVPEPIELAFTNDSNEIVNPPVNYNPRRVYTLEEVNHLIHQGVSIEKKYTVLQRIEFEFNTDKLTGPSGKYLDQLVEFMRLQPGCMVKIVGHTDNVGEKDFNQTLSEKRAASVLHYLVSKGMDKSRLSSTGYGMSKPIDTNDTPEGRDKNRRVEFEIRWR
jgi:outer membrane protein OmpA-like peptidoglycan-associated protein